MLNLNKPLVSNASTKGILLNQGRRSSQDKIDLETLQKDVVWKALIFDNLGQEVIAPLLRISDLRDNGITVHMLLHTERQSIPDIPAIYFVEPSEKSILRICEDMSKGLYESYYINFSSVLSRDLLELLAQTSLRDNTYNQISQVYDQYLNYTCLEPFMFSLNLSDSYYTLNSPKSLDSQVEAFIKQTVNSLLSIFMTTNSIPIIRASKGNAAEMVARGLESRLVDHVRNTSRKRDQSQQYTDVDRPCIVILDRNMDLKTMLSHTWSYQCLAHDVLEMNANRISYSVDESGKQVKKTFDLDLDDFFWQKNASAPFPIMAEDVDSELNKYKKEAESITSSCGVSSLDEIATSNMGTKNLQDAISALPRLTARKRTIDMHMNIASALLKQIQDRALDSFILMEENLVKQTKQSLLDILKDPSKGTPQDKLRLFIAFYLTPDNGLSKSDFAELEKVLEESGADLSALKCIKTSRSISQMVSIQQKQGGSAKGTSDLMEKFSSHFGGNLRETAFGNAVDSLISGVKNILPTSQNLPITRILESTLDGSSLSSLGIGGSGTNQDELLYFDPKASGKSIDHRRANSRQGFRNEMKDIYVFVIGGGNYVEYQNLQEYIKNRQRGETITYGSTEILNANAFINQLSKIGREQ